MSKQIQLRGGSQAENDVFTGVSREITVDTTNNTVRVHDGATVGGFQVPTQAQLALKAPLASPAFTGTVTIPTLAVTDGFDLGQSWVDVTSERAVGITYTNDTGKDIYIHFYAYNGSIAGAVSLRYSITINGIANNYGTYTGYATLGFLAKVPTGATYQIGQAGSSPEYFFWKELR